MFSTHLAWGSADSSPVVTIGTGGAEVKSKGWPQSKLGSYLDFIC